MTAMCGGVSDVLRRRATRPGCGSTKLFASLMKHGRHLIVAMLFASMICALMPASMAHGDFPPKRGGISVNAGEMTLEFVIRDGMVVVYLDDHGEPVRAQGAEATLVLTGSDGAERAIRMRVAGANAFEASDVAVKIGERVLFFAKMSDGQVHVGQLTAP